VGAEHLGEAPLAVQQAIRLAEDPQLALQEAVKVIALTDLLEALWIEQQVLQAAEELAPVATRLAALMMAGRV
jgi:hypothetical protein